HGRPDRLVAGARALAKWGATPAAGYAASAIRHPDEIAVIDERGALTFRQLHERTNALAHGLRVLGVQEGDGVAVLCRNHRGFIEAVVAASKLGANVLLLNTGFSGPQTCDVLDREGASAVVFDSEFTEIVAGAAEGRAQVVAWHEGHAPVPTIDTLIADHPATELSPPAKAGRVVILTSGTTGTPKGAPRTTPKSLDSAVALFSRIPLKARQTTVIAAPMFHAWGLAHLTLGMALSSTVVLQRRFDPEDTLRAMATHRASALAVVPVMLQRIVALPDDVRARYDTSALKVTAASGSALTGELATRWMDAFGDNLYNLYGSTEVAWATIATPEELRGAPGTAGRPPLGTVVRVLDEEGREVPTGQTGRIFVGSDMLFEGYTGGGSKVVVDGLMSVGDMGHYDANGLLFVEGRDDDMIVSGGENVFPSEVEDLLARHPAVADVAVIGVSDDEFGQRLKAFVVRRPGAEVTEPAVQAYVKEHLARYKVPREVVFLEELPRNASGKVLKRELRDL
ncbi:MAG TPA: acyl-CoA synthetase, partial [Acidimicrobiales bacterium]|nr:acyl-CoA synthetase [Acidimicrobiales bacterium]